MVNSPGWGSRSFNKVLKEIEIKKHFNLENYIYSLGIPTIGRHKSQKISDCIKTKKEFKQFIFAVKSMKSKVSQSIKKEVGEKSYTEIYQFFMTAQNCYVVEELILLLDIPDKGVISSSAPILFW